MQAVPSEAQMKVQYAGLMAGLIAALDAPVKYRGTPGLQGSIGGTWLDDCKCQTHCYRTVSQRKLTVPRRFCGIIQVPGATQVVDPIYTAWGITAPGEGNGVTFWDANDPDERPEIQDLVLIGIRAKCCLVLSSNVPLNPSGVSDSAAAHHDYEAFRQGLCCLLMSQAGLVILNGSDNRDPWVDWTPLDYFDRPGGAFVPVPPVKWTERDPRVFLEGRVPDFGTPAPPSPYCDALTYNTGVVANFITAELVIEGLWVPDPRVCSDYWPGDLCDPCAVNNVGHVNGKTPLLPDYANRYAAMARTLQQLKA